MNYKLKFLLASFISVFLFSFSIQVFAQNTVMSGAGTAEDCSSKCGSENLSPACKQYCGDYQLNDFTRIAVTVSSILLGIVGSLALLAFVVGGFMMIFSAGNKEWVEKGKASIKGAVIGLVIVFISYTIISIVFDAMGVNTGEKNIFTSSWFN